MFFRPTPPTRAELAKKAVADFVHSIAESAPTEKLAELKATALETLAHAGESVSHTLEHAKTSARQSAQHESELAQQRATAAREAAETALKTAERAAREAKNKAQNQLADVQKSLQTRRNEWERQQHELEAQKAALEAEAAKREQDARELAARQAAALEAAQRETERETAKAAAKAKSTIYDDDEIEVHLREQSGPSPLILIGAALLVGAALVYFFAPGSGRRSRAALKDRLGKVKDGAIEATTGASDEAAVKAHELVARADEISEKMEEKLAEVATPEAPASESQEAHAEALAVETYEDAVPHEAAISLSEETPATDEILEPSDETTEIPGESASGKGKNRRKPNALDKISEAVHNAADKVEELAHSDEKEHTA